MDEEAWQEQSRNKDEEERAEEVVKYMIEKELVDPSSSDTEEHYIRIRKERFQEVRSKKKRDRSPSAGSSMEVEDSSSSDGTEEFVSNWVGIEGEGRADRTREDQEGKEGGDQEGADRMYGAGEENV